MKNETNNKTTKKKETEEIEFLTLDEEPVASASSIKAKETQKENKAKTKTKKPKKKKAKNTREKKENTNRNKKNHKKIIVLTLFIVLIAICILIYMVFVQRFLVQNEIQDLEQLIQMEEINYTSIEEKLKQTVSVGPYRKVEQAFKEYVSDIVDANKEIQSLTDKEDLSNVLSADNLKKDGPDFKETEQYLTTTKEKLNTRLNDLIDLMHKEKIMSYAENKKLSKTYMDFYEEVAIDHNENLDSMQKSLQQSLDYYMQVFDTFDQAIAFLRSHDSWKIENNKLVFNSSQDYQDYNEIVKSLNQE